jgi:geranylgeranyl pyrophosphate synthase
MNRRTLSALIVAAALSGTACYTMRPVTFAELGAARPGAVWITRNDQSVIVVEAPRVYGDTLVGYVDGEFQELPQSELNPQLYQVRRMAAAKTASLIVASMLGAGTFAFLVSSTNSYHDPQTNLDCEDDPQQPGCPGATP